MRHHFPPTLQRAKDALFSSDHSTNPSRDLLSPPITSPSYALASEEIGIRLHQHVRLHMLRLLVISLGCMALIALAITAIFILIFRFRHLWVKSNAPFAINCAPAMRKLRKKRKPSPLDFKSTNSDLEAQPQIRGHHNPFSPPPPSSPSSIDEETAIGSATGTDASLTPFSAARARARRFGGGLGDVDAVDGESPLDRELRKYFFSDGVGTR